MTALPLTYTCEADDCPGYPDPPGHKGHPCGVRIPVEALGSLRRGAAVLSTYAVLDLSPGTSKTGNPYMKLELGDATGRVPAMWFDCSEAPFLVGDIASFTGTRDEWNGRAQLKIDTAWKVDVQDPREFMPCSRFSSTKMLARLRDVARNLRPDVGAVLEHVLDQVDDRLLSAPAAERNHHAFLGGLLEHTLSLVSVAGHAYDHYQKAHHCLLDHDIVIAGLILHDIGKVFDAELVGLAWEKTTPGRLVGHMGAAVRLLPRPEDGHAPELLDHLAHIILSHHGTWEWGSPVVPRTPEAVLVHSLDRMDAMMQMVAEGLQGVEPGSWSDYSRPMRTELYRPKRTEQHHG